MSVLQWLLWGWWGSPLGGPAPGPVIRVTSAVWSSPVTVSEAWTSPVSVAAAWSEPVTVTAEWSEG